MRKTRKRTKSHKEVVEPERDDPRKRRAGFAESTTSDNHFRKSFTYHVLPGMFTAEVRINGTLITHIYGRNAEDLSRTSCRYHFEIYSPAEETSKIRHGTVDHNTEEGINVLLSKILATLPKKKSRKALAKG